MNIETLKVFKDLIETENFSKTAELNYISQSAVSQQIKKLELIFKTKFFVKKDNGFVLTEGGKIFYNCAKKIVDLYSFAISNIKKDAMLKNNNELKIESIYSVGIYLAGDYVKRFLGLNPYTKINLEYKKYIDVMEDVKKGRVDFGFAACLIKREKDVAAMHIADEEMVLIAPFSSNEFRNLQEIDIKDISNFKLVCFDKNTPSRKYIEKVLKEKKVKLNITMDVDNIETIKATVISGAGVSIVPMSCIRPGEETKLKVLKFKNFSIKRSIFMIYNKRKKMSSVAASFLNMILAEKRNKLIGANDED